MRVLFVSIPHFSAAVEIQGTPGLGRRPLIIGDAELPKRVYDCSTVAAGDGVRPGMPVRKALAMCREAAVIPPDLVLYHNRWQAILAAIETVSPRAEDENLGRAYLDITGLSRHYPNETALAARVIETIREASNLTPAVGIGTGKFLAFAAGTLAAAGESLVIKAGDEAGFLAPLGVGLLPVDAKIIDRLRLLGLDTIGEVAGLSLPELQSQFGFEGRRLWKLANGIDDAPLRPRPVREEVAASLSFEAPVAGIDVLVAAGRQLLSRLREQRRERAVRELTFQAELENGRGWERRAVLREAVSEDDRLTFILRSDLANHPPPMAVRSLTLKLGNLAGETGKQLSLGRRGRLQKQVEEAIRQLKSRYGYSPVYRCVDVEPWSAIPEERQFLVESDG
jgi:nucleotidyltransferase/DNA polymerase involved in DNA repair